MIDDCCFSESDNVQSLINKFELMAQANAASNASRTRVESSTTAPQKPVDNQISRARTQSEPVQKLEETPESVVKHNTLTVKTLESDDEDDIKTLNPYEDESDVGSTMNLERRRQLEERNRNLAADKAKQLNSRTTRRPQTPERQGRLDQVRSRLFDFQNDPRWSSAAKEQSGSTKPKPTTVRSRPSSAASRARV
ncbi:hypothetical protein BBJ29_000083 [Phytophthora kernoviae]|uniref:Uncharacterized protein n=1 Tax=Phytophthora kernoviae TaxID=325452 RepID=A0A3F2S1G9_9STRA|nr:hypothetical protein BBJ29_000083 [Phytophthora kernoviae]RLN68472.1 hypothetical protein BBP00_00001040 [Phytophthora kernoviae]